MRVAWLIAILVSACVPGRDDTVDDPDPSPEKAPPDGLWAGAGLPTPHVDPWYATCAQGYADPVARALCAGVAPPKIQSLADLRQILRTTAPIDDGMSMVGESTGLAVRVVTPLNPLTIDLSEAGFLRGVAVTFARGQPFVELSGADGAGNTNFFLVRFHLACEQAHGGCVAADLLLPSVEEGWTGVDIYDEKQLKNTTRDCQQCHQPGGPTGNKMFRMQEKDSPWTHWFNPALPDRAQPFLDMHAGESYAGFAAGFTGDPQNLVTVMQDEDDYDEQPNPFSSTVIAAELAATGTSQTWTALYNASVQGLAIPPPYFGESQIDPDRARAFAETYQAVAAGAVPKEQLPDLRTLFSDSALPAMTIRPKVGLTGAGMLVQMCAQCHNATLDQTISRANFDATMSPTQMPGDERALAVQRMMLPDSDPLKMPPPFLRELSDTERTKIVDAIWQ